MKKKLFPIFLTVLLTVIALFIYVEKQPYFEMSSTIYQTSVQTDIHINVIMNTFLWVDEEEFTKEIIEKHQEINGVKKESRYMISLYRTLFHYRRNLKYHMIIYDENGVIICCEENLEL